MVFAAETICLLAGITSLIIGYAPSNLWLLDIFFLAFGLFWISSQWLRWDWIAPMAFFVFITAAGVGALIGLAPTLMAISVLENLLAWDLADFSRRLRSAAPEDDFQGLEKNHLLKLGGFGIVALFLDLLAMVVHFNISFGWMFLLTLAAVLGIIQMVSRLRRSG